MENFGLDLSLEVTEGSTHNLGHLILYLRLRACTFNPLNPKPELVVLSRGADWSLKASQPPVTNDQVAKLCLKLRNSGFPEALPKVGARKVGLAGWQHILFRVCLSNTENSHEKSLDLVLEYGGIEGEGADTIRSVWTTLVELAGLPGNEKWIKGTY